MPFHCSGTAAQHSTTVALSQRPCRAVGCVMGCVMGCVEQQQHKVGSIWEYLPSTARPFCQGCGLGAQLGWRETLSAGEPAPATTPLLKSSFLVPTESQNLPKQPPLMLALGQASECLRLMARVGLGSCSFARVDDYLH